MELIVCLKQTPDLPQVRIKRDTREAILEGVPFIFGEPDINALEEAVKIKEAQGGKVTALSVGVPKLKDTIKEALARGADEGFIVTDPSFGGLGSRAKALVLAKAIGKIGKYDLIVLGEGSADNYSGQTGTRLAELLNVPLISYVSELEVSGGQLKATRNLEDRLEVVSASLPAVITVTAQINKARIPALTQILRAGKKPLAEWKMTDTGMGPADLKDEVTLVSNLAPVQQRKQVMFTGDVDKNVNDLISALINDGVQGR